MERPAPGWVQQNPEQWWDAFCRCNHELLDGIKPGEIAGICLTGQMMCCLPVDRSGAALYPAMIWADSRAGEEAGELQNARGAEAFYQTTGMRTSANYGLPKMMWLKKHLPNIYRKTYKFLSPKDYINFKLTGRFAVDPENAAFLHCADLHTGAWAEPLIRQAGVDLEKLPEILPVSAVVGGVRPEAAKACGLISGIPVIMGPGDGGAATLGAAVLEPGEGYISLGTSSWICIVSGSESLDQKQRIAKLKYLETFRDSGTMQAGGFAHRWMEELLCGQEQLRAEKEGVQLHALVEELAGSSPAGAKGVLFQPYLMGERAPIWDTEMRGAFLGLTADTLRGDLCRSVLEGVALHLHWIYRCILETNAMRELSSIKLVGGGAQSSLWTQIFADVFSLPVEIVGKPDQVGALGTAAAAGVGLGIYSDYTRIRDFQPTVRVVQPDRAKKCLYRELGTLLERSAAVLAPLYHNKTAM